jgi:hypothetical protein
MAADRDSNAKPETNHRPEPECENNHRRSVRTDGTAFEPLSFPFLLVRWPWWLGNCAFA